MKTLLYTNFDFPGLTKFYRGKVRDIYIVENRVFIMIVTDRISAFDVILDKGVPFKGQVLNELASFFLDMTSDIVPNWKITKAHPRVIIGEKCEPLPIEIIVRGYIAGSAWRAYKQGKRVISGVKFPENLRENQKLPYPVITPTTKAEHGHDIEISKQEIIDSGLVQKHIYEQIEKYALELFNRGSQYANSRGLILVDTKYEFGLCNGEIMLIDEVHTPDSSRYFYLSDYQEKFEAGQKPKHLSKEFVRQWLIANNFMGEKNQSMPYISDDVIDEISARYIELYEVLTAKKFQKVNDTPEQIYNSIMTYLKNIL